MTFLCDRNLCLSLISLPKPIYDTYTSVYMYRISLMHHHTVAMKSMTNQISKFLFLDFFSLCEVRDLKQNVFISRGDVIVVLVRHICREKKLFRFALEAGKILLVGFAKIHVVIKPGVLTPTSLCRLSLFWQISRKILMRELFTNIINKNCVERSLCLKQTDVTDTVRYLKNVLLVCQGS